MNADSTSIQNICLLGCGGFIGSHLCERILSSTDWRIYGVDRNPAKISAFLSNPRFTYANIDIDAAEGLDEYLHNSDVVVSLVALCNPSQYNTVPLQVIDANFTRPFKIVERCASLGKRLIHFSTCEVYGTTVSYRAGMPFNSNTDIFREQTTPLVLGPVSAQRWTYACAKQLLERAIFAHGEENGLDYTIVRPFNFIGPRMDYLPGIDGEGVPRVLACFMDALLSQKPLKLVDGGRNRRTFTDIRDAIDATMAILARPMESRRKIFNIGNPANETTIADLAKIMIALYRELRPGLADVAFCTQTVSSMEFYGAGYEDSDRRVPDISEARTLLGWNPSIMLKDALRSAMTFYIKEYSGAQACREAV
jgi:UDP-apiose/xylose synthase